jgi:hypothetical protein
MRPIFICFFLISFPSLIKAQVNDDVNIIDLIRDLQQWNKRDDKMSLLWWIPTEYWNDIKRLGMHCCN